MRHRSVTSPRPPPLRVRTSPLSPHHSAWLSGGRRVELEWQTEKAAFREVMGLSRELRRSGFDRGSGGGCSGRGGFRRRRVQAAAGWAALLGCSAWLSLGAPLCSLWWNILTDLCSGCVLQATLSPSSTTRCTSRSLRPFTPTTCASGRAPTVASAPPRSASPRGGRTSPRLRAPPEAPRPRPPPPLPPSR